MSIRLARLLLAAMLVIVGGLTVSAAPAVAGSIPVAAEKAYTGAVTTTGADQCSSPVNARKGAWICPDTSKARSNAGTCSALGCWYYVANYWAEFSGDGIYGYNGTTLGYTEFFIEVQFSGGSSTSKPFQFESTRGTKQVRASGERLYFSSAHPEGYPVSGGATYKTWSGGPYGAGALVNGFGSGGYTAYEGTVPHAGVAHQFDWTDPSSSYPGRWYTFIKSPKFHRNSAGAYNLDNPPQLGSAWYGSGWSPS
ncbi:hypothetical protein ACLQ28_03270 [Micromonospora sp. DT201]|uniref:hypothetical protein n=1 Tax=Micromonospora sp. DT201 TaxID=3393442 RepID=UPI003CE953EB